LRDSTSGAAGGQDAQGDETSHGAPRRRRQRPSSVACRFKGLLRASGRPCPRSGPRHPPLALSTGRRPRALANAALVTSIGRQSAAWWAIRVAASILALDGHFEVRTYLLGTGPSDCCVHVTIHALRRVRHSLDHAGRESISASATGGSTTNSSSSTTSSPPSRPTLGPIRLSPGRKSRPQRPELTMFSASSLAGRTT
jgi:hypothetical protein